MSDAKSPAPTTATQIAEVPPAQSESRALARAMPTTATGALQARNFGEAIEIAKMFAHSGMVPKQYDGNVGACLVAMQMGAELGLSPMASLQNIAVINGRPSLWGDAVLAVVMAHPDFVDILETEGDGWAKCIVKRRGKTPVERMFSVADAKGAGLWGKQGPWSQYPRRMLQMRARGFAVRDAFPDALRGIVTAEEAQDIPEGAVDGQAEFVDAASIPEGTHKFGFTKQAPAAQAGEQPHDPKTGEVKQPAPTAQPQAEAKPQSKPAAKTTTAPSADPKAGF
jgi:hypothetical protein